MKAWVPPKENATGEVDGITVGSGKENAAELTEDQVQRLRDAGLKVETDSKAQSGEKSGKGDKSE